MEAGDESLKLDKYKKTNLKKRHPSNGDALSNQSVDSVKRINYSDVPALAGALISPVSMAVLKCMKMAISNCTFSYIFLYTHLKN